MVRGLVGGWRMFVVLAFLAACLLRFSKKLSAKNRDTIWPSCPDFEFREDFACGIRIKFQELQRGKIVSRLGMSTGQVRTGSV